MYAALLFGDLVVQILSDRSRMIQASLVLLAFGIVILMYRR